MFSFFSLLQPIGRKPETALAWIIFIGFFFNHFFPIEGLDTGNESFRISHECKIDFSSVKSYWSLSQSICLSFTEHFEVPDVHASL